jgi:leader peptidase (prepilin peptidase)/N-methyltransferase
VGVIGGLIVLAWAGALSVYDIGYRRLPDWLTLPAVAVVWSGAVLLGHGWAVVGGAAWFLSCVLARECCRPGSGPAGATRNSP